MQFVILLCLLILQQTISVLLLIPPAHSVNHELGRSSVARRFRGPLMGRSIIPRLSDDVELINNDIINSDENKTINLSKRRYSFAILSRRKWINSKRKGSHFG